MPELPEVETVRRELASVLQRRRLRGVAVHLAKMVRSSRASLRRAFRGARVTAVRRRAKLLLIELSTGWTAVVHLKMSGQLIWKPTRGRLRGGGHPIPGALDVLPNRYSHLIFHFAGGDLFFNDLRQFGWLCVVRTAELPRWLEQQGFGPEVVDGQLALDAFEARLRQRRRSRLKTSLLDQRFVAGLGNIYADEALFAARLKPTRRVGSLTRVERVALFRGITHVLALGVAKGGTTLRFFRRPNGARGGMKPYLKVYGRDGQPCRRCRATIVKTRVANRGTHLCPHCQR